MNSWLAHLKQFRQQHPNLSYKQCMIDAKATYKKGSGNSVSIISGKQFRKNRYLELIDIARRAHNACRPNSPLANKLHNILEAQSTNIHLLDDDLLTNADLDDIIKNLEDELLELNINTLPQAQVHTGHGGSKNSGYVRRLYAEQKITKDTFKKIKKPSQHLINKYGKQSDSESENENQTQPEPQYDDINLSTIKNKTKLTKSNSISNEQKRVLFENLPF